MESIGARATGFLETLSRETKISKLKSHNHRLLLVQRSKKVKKRAMLETYQREFKVSKKC